MKWNFGLDKKVEFKKSVGLYRHTLVSSKTKVDENIAWTKVNEIQQIFKEIF
jgi:hypothetical protein